MRRSIVALLLSALAIGPTQAGTFKIEVSKPPVSITVPDDWSPNRSQDGVDGISPDNSVSFLLYDAQAKDAAAANGDALNVLTRNGMTIDRNSTQASVATLAGLAATATQYSASEDEKPRQVRIVIAPVSGKRHLQLVQWGTAEGARKNAAALKKIFDSIKVK
jgi:hypothetical protein